jgi:queuine/archaeosine tRNA-ribosyltransferase
LPLKTKRKLSYDINEYSRKGGFVFLDSGIYESYWKADNKWTKDFYKASIAEIDFDFYSSFDVLPIERRSKEFEKETLSSIIFSRSLSDKPGFVPILHGKTPNKLVSLVREFVKEKPDLCNFIAVPERDCGVNIIEKAQTIGKIRKILDDEDANNYSRILHILGCGNPMSLLLFSYYGANTFDSLNWICNAIDPDRLVVDDFSFLELINCNCSICTDASRCYTEKVFLHNLLFYQNYVLGIQSLIRNDGIHESLSQRVGKNILERINRLII